MLVAPPGAGDNAATPEQAAFIGNQAGGSTCRRLVTWLAQPGRATAERIKFQPLSGRTMSSDPRPVYKPHPRNVPGPVYVADGCCLYCGIWELDAPEHFSWQDGPSPHCFVSRQPETDEELEKITEAMQSQDLDCIRVRGCSDRWRTVLEAKGLGDYIDD